MEILGSVYVNENEVFDKYITIPTSSQYIRKQYKIGNIMWKKHGELATPGIKVLLIYNTSNSKEIIVRDEVIMTDEVNARIVLSSTKINGEYKFNMVCNKCLLICFIGEPANVTVSTNSETPSTCGSYIGLIRLTIDKKYIALSTLTTIELNEVSKLSLFREKLMIYVPLHPKLCRLDKYILRMMHKAGYRIIPNIIDCKNANTIDECKSAILGNVDEKHMICVDFSMSVNSCKGQSELCIFMCIIDVEQWQRDRDPNL